MHCHSFSFRSVSVFLFVTYISFSTGDHCKWYLNHFIQKFSLFFHSSSRIFAIFSSWFQVNCVRHMKKMTHLLVFFFSYDRNSLALFFLNLSRKRLTNFKSTVCHIGLDRECIVHIDIYAFGEQVILFVWAGPKKRFDIYSLEFFRLEVNEWCRYEIVGAFVMKIWREKKNQPKK